MLVYKYVHVIILNKYFDKHVRVLKSKFADGLQRLVLDWYRNYFVWVK